MSLVLHLMVHVFFSEVVLLEQPVKLMTLKRQNIILTAQLLKQGYRYHNQHKTFYRHHSELLLKCNVGLKTLLQEGLSELEFYTDLVFKFRILSAKLIIQYNLKTCQSLQTHRLQHEYSAANSMHVC